jgi:hypothetical protein
LQCWPQWWQDSSLMSGTLAIKAIETVGLLAI